MTQHKQRKATTKKAGTPRKATKTPRAPAKAPARKKAPKAEMPAQEAPDPRERAQRLPAPGAVLSRSYKGEDYRVTVLDDGFRWEGKDFRSLTALARTITGYPAISGPAWFGLTEPKAAPRAPKRKGKAADTQAPAAGPAPTAGTPTD